MAFPALDLAPQKYKDAGLRPSASSPNKIDATSKSTQEKDESENTLGGLADEDALAVRPEKSGDQQTAFERPSEYPTGLKRDSSRKNEVCHPIYGVYLKD